MSLVGQPAPLFTLPSHRGDTVSLAQFRGDRNVVVMFYPFAFTGVCTGELCTLRDRRDEITDAGAALLGISCDPVPALKTFAAKAGLADPLLSDFWPHGAVSTAYGVFLEQKGFATRGTFVVDRAGIVRWSVVNPPGEARDVDELMTVLHGLDEASVREGSG